MWLKVTDSKAYFATYFIHIEATDEIRKKIKLQVEKTGIVCYSVEELNEAVQGLNELKADFTVEELKPNPTFMAKAQGVKYLTPEEVKKHVTEDKEPDSQILPNLRKELAEQDATIAGLRAERNIEIQTLRDELKAIKEARQ